MSNQTFSSYMLPIDIEKLKLTIVLVMSYL